MFEDTKMIKTSTMPTNPIPILYQKAPPDTPLLTQESHLERRSFGIGLVYKTFINDSNFPNAPHGSTILIHFDEDKPTEFRGCLERERNV